MTHYIEKSAGIWEKVERIYTKEDFKKRYVGRWKKLKTKTIVKMKTTKDKILRLLDTLPEPYNKQSIANYDPSFYEDGAPINNSNDALGWAFDWEKSPQGADYWMALRRHLEDGDPLPEIKESKHTPTPWKINPVETYHLDIVGNERPLYPNKKGGLQWDRICRMDDNFERRAETQANAAFIVKACNSYEEMLEYLQTEEKYLRSLYEQGTLSEPNHIKWNNLKALIDKLTSPIT